MRILGFYTRAHRVVVALGATLLLLSSASAQTLQGDCNDNEEVTIGELVRCANIFNMPTRLAECPACDQNGDGSVSIGEVQGASNCFLNATVDAGCRPITPPPTNTVPPTATPTNTPVPPTETNTPVPPTETNTPVPPTLTFTPVPPTETFTPVPATLTPTETPVTPPTSTNTPVPPTLTPTATATSGGESVTFDLTLMPSGATNGNCRGVCTGGTSPGAGCVSNSNCGTGGTCGSKTCVGGPFNGQACTAFQQCAACRPGTTVDPFSAGSCAVIQGPALTIPLPQNGVCSPRTSPEVTCVSDAECGAGKTCRLPFMRMTFGPADANGVRAVSIDPDHVFFPPSVINLAGTTACITGGGEGVGQLDCDGGLQGLNFTLSRDHNVTASGTCVRGTRQGQSCTASTDCPIGAADNFPCGSDGMCTGGQKGGLTCETSADCPDAPFAICNNPSDTSIIGGGIGNTGAAVSGFGDDPDCNDFVTLPNGLVNETCLEGIGSCVGGSNADAACRVNSDCPGGACAQCNSNNPHDGVCNSAIRVASEGAFGAGDMVVIFPLAISQLRNANPADKGPDGLPCTADDLPPSPPASVPVTLSTGTNTIQVWDAAGNGFNAVGEPKLHVTPDYLCGNTPCVARTSGKEAVCSDIDAMSPTMLKGTAFGGGFPALDLATVTDIATTFRFEILSAKKVTP